MNMNAPEHPNPSSHAQAVELDFPETKTTAIKKTLIAIVLGMIIAISWTGFIDSQSQAYIDGSLKQALIAYAVARTVNAVVSVLQTISLLGLGIGEALDPINDLVERFSSVMELAIASLFIQKILLTITASWFFKLALTVSGGLLILSLYIRTGLNSLMISRVFISLVFIRFCIAVVVVLNGLVATAFVNDQIDHEVAIIEQAGKSEPIPEPAEEAANEVPAPLPVTPPVETPPQADASPANADPAPKSWFGKIKEMGSNAISKGIVVTKEQYKKLNPKAMKEKIEKIIPQMINTMALFFLKSLILPLVFLYALKYALTQVWDLKPIPLYTGKPRLTLGKQNRGKLKY